MRRLEVLEGARSGAEGSRLLRRAGALALLLHEALELLLVDGHLPLGGDLAREVEREAVGVVELEGDRGGQLGPRVASAAQGLVEDAHALLERAAEAHLLVVHDAPDLVALGDELRVRLAHEVDDLVGEDREEGLVDADAHALLHGTTDDAPQHVVAALVAGQDAVHDEEGGGAGVLGHGLQGADDRRRPVRAGAGELRAPGDQAARTGRSRRR